MSNNTPMGKIAAFHNIKCYLSEEEQTDLASKLGLNEVDLTKRIEGKDNEIEFILMLYLLQSCKSIVGFEEGVAKLTDTVSTDLFVELNNGSKIVIEIKSTSKNKFKISEKLLNEKINFASDLNADLYFAIKIKGIWALYHSDYILSKNRKITLEDDYINSKLNSVFGDETFVFPKGLQIQSTYTKLPTDNLGISNGQYGNLINYKVNYKNECLLEISNTKNLDMLIFSFCYENIQDFMSVQKQEITSIDNNTTLISEEFTENSQMNISAFIMSPIKHIQSESGPVYNFHQYLVSLIEKKDQLLTKEIVFGAINYLAKQGYPVIKMDQST